MSFNNVSTFYCIASSPPFIFYMSLELKFEFWAFIHDSILKVKINKCIETLEISS